jgi:hypothetical protein
MLVFVDESGDGGMNFASGSSALFAVGLVVFASDEAALACDLAIRELKSRLGLPRGFEFHFAQNSARQQRAFLEVVARFPFEHHVFAVDKARTTGPGLRLKESLYKWTVRAAFENAADFIADATVVIDGSGDRAFRKELASYLRRRLNDPGSNARPIHSVKLQPAHQNHLLQLADYVVGVSARSLNRNATAADLYREFLRQHERTVRLWPTTTRRASP